MLAKNDPALDRSHTSTSTGTQVQAASSTWQLAGWFLFTFVLCIHFSLTYNAIADYLNLDQYTRGLVELPYQYRALPMFIFRLLVHTRFIVTLAKHAPVQFHDPHQMVQVAIALFGILGAVFATWGTLTRLTGDSRFSRWFSLLIVYMAYFNLAPGWGLSYTFPYDVPSLTFFSLGIYLIVSERLWLFYLLFPFAVLNRETTCFLTIFFLIWNVHKIRERLEKPSVKDLSPVLLHVLAQAIIWIAVKAWLAHLFAANRLEAHNSFFAVRLFFNIKELLKPQQWPVYLSCCGFLLPVLWVQRKWIRCAGIYWACAIIVPLWFVGMMIVGVVPEIRVFSELSTFIVPALGLIVYNRFRLSASCQDQYAYKPGTSID